MGLFNSLPLLLPKVTFKHTLQVCESRSRFQLQAQDYFLGRHDVRERLTLGEQPEAGELCPHVRAKWWSPPSFPGEASRRNETHLSLPRARAGTSNSAVRGHAEAGTPEKCPLLLSERTRWRGTPPVPRRRRAWVTRARTHCRRTTQHTRSNDRGEKERSPGWLVQRELWVRTYSGSGSDGRTLAVKAGPASTVW